MKTDRSSNLVAVTKASVGPIKRIRPSKCLLFNANECSYRISTLYIRA